MKNKNDADNNPQKVKPKESLKKRSVDNIDTDLLVSIEREIAREETNVDFNSAGAGWR